MLTKKGNTQSLLASFLLIIFLVNYTYQVTCGNPILDRIKEQKESYLGNIVLDVSSHGRYDFCKTEFNMHGTCCDVNKMKEALPKLLDSWTDEV